MTTIDFFQGFWAEVRKTKQWATMEGTVEGSEWHREANVAVHTTMCIEHYIANTAQHRTERQQMMTLMTLLFHDFGKPEAEETLPAKDGSDNTYHRYAGHEPVSANEFISFVCDHEVLMKTFFARGFGWEDVRKIKFMIEHHLPFGLKNTTKRQNLRNAVSTTLEGDEVCFYDQLWSDCCGRISDDHETKKANVVVWCNEFQAIVPQLPKTSQSSKTMYVLCGPVGAGKSTWTEKFKSLNPSARLVVISEDVYRLKFFCEQNTPEQVAEWMAKGAKERYAFAWQYCFENSKEYDLYAKEQLRVAVGSGRTLVLDRTNQTRKSRGPWVTAAKTAGYKVHTIEFYISEHVMHARQKSRTDKDVPYNRAHMIYMNMDVPQVGVEVDAFEVVPPWN